MPGHAYKLLLLVIFISYGKFSVANELSPTTTRLLQISGITNQVEEFPRFIKEGMLQAKQQDHGIQDDTFKEMLAMVDDAMNTTVMLNEIGNKLSQSLNVNDTQDILSWYESRAGKTITAAEEHASTPEAYHEMLQQSASLLKDQKRIDYARSVDKLLSATQFTLDLHIHTQLAVVSAFSSVLEPEAPRQLDAYKAQVQNQVENLRTGIQQFVVLSFAYSYQAISDEDLNDYKAFLETPAARNFNQVAMLGISETLQRAIAVLAKRIADIKIEKPVAPGVGKDEVFI